jgi:type IV pilus assembly protein PilY1
MKLLHYLELTLGLLIQQRKQFSLSALLAASTFMLSSATSYVATIPTVDLRVGPVAISQQATNIALSLSVEFPTVGAAYRTAVYDHSLTYPGYWHEKSCYNYKDTSAGAPLSGEYFVRSGAVDADGFCNTSGAGTGYSGNALNYVATSSIDILRYALTGGNRVVDTTNATVVERAYLYNGWDLNNTTYFPVRRFPDTLEGKVTPDYDGNGDVYGGSCQNKIWFGRANTANANCDNPGTAGNLNPLVPDPSSTTTVVVNAGAPAPSGGVFLTTTYEVTNPLVTSSVTPTVGPITFNDIVIFGTGTTTSVPPSGAAGAFITNSYVVNGLTTTVTPTAPEPTVLVGTTSATLATRYYYSSPQSGPGIVNRAFNLTTGSARVCANTNSSTPTIFVGRFDNAGSPTSVTPAQCSSGNSPFTGLSNRVTLTGFPRTVYEPMRLINIYARHDIVPVYKSWTASRIFDTYVAKDNYVVTGTRIGPMFARVKVCDAAESATRTDLCFKYPAGNFKPIGEVQKNSSGVRVGAFGYAQENGNGRYGGVLRAPIDYLGPVFRDAAGTLQNNPNTEWDSATGIYSVDPRGASPTFALSGTINYLNKFGSTGTLGAYKSNDPVGELYYESLRYYMGLGPTAAATANLTTAMYDGFPIYSTAAEAPSTLPGWVDPIQNACQRRNYILNIGDVNTWHDRQLPGHGTGISSALTNATDPARSAENLLGSGTFNVVDWVDKLTGFERNLARSYTDALGRTQSTAGNPNPRTSLPEMGSNGTGIQSAWYWAAAAYWANTQPIRNDTKDSKSMKEVRVKTFTIDVDEGGNGSIEDSNPRGNKPRASAAYLAGKYGWFNDINRDGSPFKTSGGLVNNNEWQDPEAPNTPDGYVLAGQAQKLIDAIRKFFASATGDSGALSVSAVSSQRFTANDPNGDLYEPRFNSNNWSGTVIRRQLVLNTSTFQVESDATILWDAGKILTEASATGASNTDPRVTPANRKIFSFSRDGSVETGVEFTAANLSQLDTEVRNSLNTNPANSATDNQAEARINWLRGIRSDERTLNTGFLRARQSIMGDVINSGPVFKKRADTDVQGPDYSAFANSIENRTPVIYVGANDGMFHAFRATDGKELFAYVPRAVSTKLNILTNPSYIHQPYVDGVPTVSEAQVGGAWRTIAASGFGGGAQGVFALDVTDPDNFNASKVMFEFTDRDDVDMGNVLRAPRLVRMRMAGTGAPEFKWYLAVSSGYNNYQNDGYSSTDGAQALFLLSLDKAPGQTWALNSNYFKIKLDSAGNTEVNALANPGFATGPNGEAEILYAGDLRGNMWKFSFRNGLSAANAATAVQKLSGSTIPLAIAKDAAGAVQPITVTPLITPARGTGYMVVFGTGKFAEPTDSSTTQTHSVFGIWDNLENTSSNFQVGKNKLFQRTIVAGTSGLTLSGSATFAFGAGSSGTYRGWYFDLPTAGERISTEMAQGIGFAAINTTLPTGECSGDGTGYSLCLDNIYGTSVCGFNLSTVGLLSRPNNILVENDETGYSSRSNTGKRTLTIRQISVSPGTKIQDGTSGLNTSGDIITKIPAGRLGWREIKNF